MPVAVASLEATVLVTMYVSSEVSIGHPAIYVTVPVEVLVWPEQWGHGVVDDKRLVWADVEPEEVWLDVVELTISDELEDNAVEVVVDKMVPLDDRLLKVELAEMVPFKMLEDEVDWFKELVVTVLLAIPEDADTLDVVDTEEELVLLASANKQSGIVT